MMTSEKARELGLTPLARVHTAVLAADDPVIMLTAPIPATKKALKKSGLTVDDIGVFEVNEAFSPVPLAWLAEIGADPARLNPNGGAIALGHPLGGSGARIMTTMLHHMVDNGLRYGLQTMCEGGGQANATIPNLRPPTRASCRYAIDTDRRGRWRTVQICRWRSRQTPPVDNSKKRWRGRRRGRRLRHACQTAPADSSSSTSAKPKSASTARVCAPTGAIAPAGSAPIGPPPGPASNRGAGAGWSTPPVVTNVPRAARCGSDGASVMLRIGATHASVPTNALDHSPCERSRNRAANRDRISSHRGAVVLGGEIGRHPLGREQQPDELRVELRLERADRHVPPVGRLVHVVERGAGVEPVDAALVGPRAVREQPVRHRLEHRGAVDDRGVDDLPAPGRAGGKQRRHHAEGQEHRPAAEVAEVVHRHLRRPAGPADRVQRPGDRDVGDVVAGRGRQRPVLAPAGHPPVDQRRVARPAVGRADAEPLGHAGPVPLDQRVGRGRQPPYHLGPARVLEVHHDPLLAPAGDVVLPARSASTARPAGPPG